MTGIAPALDTSLLAVAPAATAAPLPSQPVNQLFNQLLVAMQGGSGGLPVTGGQAPQTIAALLAGEALPGGPAPDSGGKELPQSGNTLPPQGGNPLAQLLRQIEPGTIALVASRLRPGLESELPPDGGSAGAEVPAIPALPVFPPPAPVMLSAGQSAQLHQSVPVTKSPPAAEFVAAAAVEARTATGVQAAGTQAEQGEGGTPLPRHPLPATASTPETLETPELSSPPRTDRAEGSAAARVPVEKSAVFAQWINELQQTMSRPGRSADTSQSAVMSAVPAAPVQPTPLQQPTAPAMDLRVVQHALNDPGWAEAFGGRVTWMAQNGVQSASVHLTPAHLGPIQVRISMGEHGANIEFHTHQSATGDLIQQSLPRLAAALEAHGIRLDDARISHGNLQSDGSGGQQAQAQQGDSRSAQQGATARQPSVTWFNESVSMPSPQGSNSTVVVQGVDYYA